MFKAGLYEHYKGGKYRALALVAHHDTEELFVVYVPYDHPESGVRIREWASPAKDSWTDSVLIVVETGKPYLPGYYPEAPETRQVPRFRYIGP